MVDLTADDEEGEELEKQYKPQQVQDDSVSLEEESDNDSLPDKKIRLEPKKESPLSK